MFQQPFAGPSGVKLAARMYLVVGTLNPNGIDVPHFMALGGTLPFLWWGEGVKAEIGAQRHGRIRGVRVQANADRVGDAGDAVESRGDQNRIARRLRSEVLTTPVAQGGDFLPSPAGNGFRQLYQEPRMRNASAIRE